MAAKYAVAYSMSTLVKDKNMFCNIKVLIFTILEISFEKKEKTTVLTHTHTHTRRFYKLFLISDDDEKTVGDNTVLVFHCCR